MRRRIILGVGLVVFSYLLAACAGILAPIQLLVNLMFGWALYFVRVIPNVRPNLAAILSGLFCLFVLGFGGHAYLRWLNDQIVMAADNTQSRPKPWPARLTVALLALVVLMFVAGISAVGIAHQAAWLVTSPDPIIESDNRIRIAAAQMYSAHNMKQIVFAMAEYADDEPEGRLPPAVILNREGQPVLSWRVALLPYLDQEDLFNEFHQEEPWDSPHNLRLLPRMPKIYAPPPQLKDETDPIRTHYRVFTGVGTAFEGRKGLRLKADFPDGPGKSIFVIEANESVPWTKPEELPYDADGPLPALGFASMTTFVAGRGDGSFERFTKEADEKSIRAAILRNGGEPTTPK
jgi:hypothetical protein